MSNLEACPDCGQYPCRMHGGGPYTSIKLRQAAQAYLDATDPTTQSWMYESEHQRMTRVAEARKTLQDILNQ